MSLLITQGLGVATRLVVQGYGAVSGGISGTIAATEAADTLAIAGTAAGGYGNLNLSEARDSLAITGLVQATGGLALVERADGVVIVGYGVQTTPPPVTDVLHPHTRRLGFVTVDQVPTRRIGFMTGYQGRRDKLH